MDKASMDPDVIERYRAIEARVKKGDVDALLARWECGKQIRADAQERVRSGLGPLRLSDLSNALEISIAELYNREQFAKEYPTEAMVREAFKTIGSWHAICRRESGPTSTTTECCG